MSSWPSCSAGGVTHLPRFEAGWANTLAELFSGLGVLLGLALLFPAVASAFIGLFLDDIADAVERQHYPADPPGRALAAGRPWSDRCVFCSL